MLHEYAIAIDLQSMYMLFVDVHKGHGNTEFTDCDYDWLRISLVLYYREYMYKCKSPTEQLKEIKQNKNGFLTL